MLTGPVFGSSHEQMDRREDQMRGQLVKGQIYSVKDSDLDPIGHGEPERSFELRD